MSNDTRAVVRHERGRVAQQGISGEIRRLQKTHALLIAIQFASNHDAEFDVSDALAAIIGAIEESLRALDKIALEAAR
ncbi:hypothetical protein GCM10011487_22420 [Steroidobacter agaridevorans]|uniref:Uncharacterized protein n=1 Tax=Steroidobacter agaridevorans TaxID=2695856 RepID=A0A829YCB8_9GAMM|nr:hypothetical protein [Steroidobacter agaridevorans]GFE80242.1 hypothetical protein GCM10011487_22420 [Steroidobacter agaridevorans]